MGGSGGVVAVAVEEGAVQVEDEEEGLGVWEEGGWEVGAVEVGGGRLGCGDCDDGGSIAVRFAGGWDWRGGLGARPLVRWYVAHGFCGRLCVPGLLVNAEGGRSVVRWY